MFPGLYAKEQSSSSDGIPPELISIVAPLILNSFNFAIEKGALRDLNTAHTFTKRPLGMC